jgi:hypothetical protein
VRKLNGNINLVRRKVFDALGRGMLVHNARHFVAVGRGQGGQRLAHLAVADEENLHLFFVFCCLLLVLRVTLFVFIIKKADD